MPIHWPDEFFELPGLGAAVIRADSRPCPGRPGRPCGEVDFLVVESEGGSVSVGCPKCCPPKKGDRVLGILDRTAWVMRRR